MTDLTFHTHTLTDNHSMQSSEHNTSLNAVVTFYWDENMLKQNQQQQQQSQ